jgi:hypothetical protein
MRANPEEQAEIRSRFGALIVGLIIVIAATSIGHSYLGGQISKAEPYTKETYETIQSVLGYMRVLAFMVAIALGAYLGIMYTRVPSPGLPLLSLLVFLPALWAGLRLPALALLYPAAAAGDLLASRGVPPEEELSLTLRRLRGRLGEKGMALQLLAVELPFLLAGSLGLSALGLNPALPALATAFLSLHLLATAKVKAR